MNERIRELMKSAITDCFDDQLDRDGDLDRMYIPNVFAEKFAELIVRECAFVAENKGETNLDLLYGRAVAAGKIREHFGVWS